MTSEDLATVIVFGLAMTLYFAWIVYARWMTHLDRKARIEGKK